MGSHTTDVSSKAVYRTLRLHPNFAFPPIPKFQAWDEDAIEKAVRFAVESVANYVSPPKLDGENDEFACIDVAKSIREQLLPDILSKVKHGR